MARGPRSGGLLASMALLAMVALAAASLYAYGWGYASYARAQATSVVPVDSIIIVSSVGSTWVDNFNPFSMPGPQANQKGLVFEYLAYVTPTGQIIPWLAVNWTVTKAYMWKNVSGKMVKIPTVAIIYWLRRGVTFANGHPFNATDVWYSLAINKAFPALNFGYTGEIIANMTIINPYEIEIVYNSNDTLSDLFNTLIVPIVDAETWSKVWPLEQLPNGTIISLNKTSPVGVSIPFNSPLFNGSGTGPYIPYSFSPSLIVYVARKNYWMPGEPRIKWIYFPAYTSAPVAIEDLMLGKITWATLFTTNITMFHAANPACYQYGLDSNNTAPDELMINYMKWPFNYTALRQAISMVINRTYIADKIYAGLAFYSPAVPMAPGTLYMLNSTVLYWAKYFAPPEGNVTRAIDWLEAHGFKFVDGQLYAPNGTDISSMTFTIIAPSGSTAYDAEITAIAEELKAIGLNVVPETLPWGEWMLDVLSGEYDMTIKWTLTAGPLFAPTFIFKPYYYGWGPYYNITPPIGNSSFWFDQERLNVTRYPWLRELNMEAGYYYAINFTKYEQLVNALAYWWVKLMPAVPTVDAADVYEYVNCTVTGWPTPSHYYWIASIIEDHNILPVVLALKPVNESYLPEPWWYYIQAYTLSQVPEQWKVSNDPFITVTTTTTPVTTTTTTVPVTTTVTTSTTTTSVVTRVATTTVTSVSTVVSTVTRTVTKYVASATYIAAAVVVTAIVVGLAVWAATRR